MENLNLSRKDLRLLILYEYNLGHTATEAKQNICSAMGNNVISYKTVVSWFKQFKQGNYSIDDAPHPGSQPKVDIDYLKQLIEDDPRQSTRILGEQVKCSHVVVAKHLNDMGKIYKYGSWIPHVLSQQQQNSRVEVCMQLLTYSRTQEWIKSLITGDEKWVLYVNHRHKKQWLEPGESGIPTPKSVPHQKKIMLCVWWGINGIIHWELMPANTTVTADVYCNQLDRVAEKLDRKQKKVFFLHDNARPHVALKTHQKLLELGWTVLPHPAYSPDLAPTDYHLFRSLSHYLANKQFNNESHLKQELDAFFNHKSLDFYRNGILSLPERWRQVIHNNGGYILNS